MARSIVIIFLSALAAGQAETYSKNFLCRQNNCVNPAFPGYNDLMLLEGMTWQCPPSDFQFGLLHFCKDTVNYAPALPNPSGSTTVASLITAQDNAAQTQYFYHLSAMGYDAWDYQSGSKAVGEDSCVTSVRDMLCNTYFPKPDAGCVEGQTSLYRRPCANACQNYLQACNVECCDEGPTCVFEHDAFADVLQVSTVDSTYASLLGQAQEAARTLQEETRDMTILQTGYVDVMGPSALCTGAAGRSASVPVALILGLLGLQLFCGMADGQAAKAESHGQARRAASHGLSRLALAGLLTVLAVSSQGCSIPTHSEALWRQKTSYLISYNVQAPGSSGSAIMNSCQHADLPSTEQCSGRGYCMPYDPDLAMTDGALNFCKCSKGWADPECRTKRKSQVAAFCYSLFLGCLGADLYYLGYPIWATFKLFTFGGFGVWWVYDVIRTGSAAVYSGNGFRVEHDMSFTAYVLGTTAVLLTLSFIYAICGALYVKQNRRQKQFVHSENEEHRKTWREEELEGNKFWGHQKNSTDEIRTLAMLHRDSKHYGSTLPFALPNAGEPSLYSDK